MGQDVEIFERDMQKCAEYCFKVLKDRHDIDITQYEEGMARVYDACLVAQEELANKGQTAVYIPALYPGFDFVMTLTAAKCKKLGLDICKPNPTTILLDEQNRLDRQEEDIDTDDYYAHCER